MALFRKNFKLFNIHEISKVYGNVYFKPNHALMDMPTMAMSMEVVALDPTMVDINVNGRETMEVVLDTCHETTIEHFGILYTRAKSHASEMDVMYVQELNRNFIQLRSSPSSLIPRHRTKFVSMLWCTRCPPAMEWRHYEYIN